MPKSKLFSYRDKLQVLYRKLQQLSGELGISGKEQCNCFCKSSGNTWERRAVGRDMKYGRWINVQPHLVHWPQRPTPGQFWKGNEENLRDEYRTPFVTEMSIMFFKNTSCNVQIDYQSLGLITSLQCFKKMIFLNMANNDKIRFLQNLCDIMINLGASKVFNNIENYSRGTAGYRWRHDLFLFSVNIKKSEIDFKRIVWKL